MPSHLSRNRERTSGGRALLTIGRPSLPEAGNRSNRLRTGTSTSSDIYAGPDVYDMECEGASNHEAGFFARLLARVRPRDVLEFACGSGRVTFTLATALPRAEIVGVDSSERLVTDFASLEVDPDVLEKVDPIFYGDLRQVAFKALGLN
jgi:tRNA1(Val) A37 N6-methylase TrmN6